MTDARGRHQPERGRRPRGLVLLLAAVMSVAVVLMLVLSVPAVAPIGFTVLAVVLLLAWLSHTGKI